MLDPYIGNPEFLPDLIVDHQSLLFALPVVLLSTSIIVFTVYRDHVDQKHSRDYRAAVMFSVVVSLCAILALGLESVLF